jgi:hypothetical protein
VADDIDRWEVDQDAQGNPLVRHRHDADTAPDSQLAYVTKDAYGSLKAWCPTCKEQLLLDGRPKDGRPA